MSESEGPSARATIHLPGDEIGRAIRPGDVIPVDLSSGYVQRALKGRHLVLVEEPPELVAVEELSPTDDVPSDA